MAKCLNRGDAFSCRSHPRRVVEGEDENPAVPGLIRLCGALKDREDPVCRLVGDHHLQLRLGHIGRLTPHSPVDERRPPEAPNARTSVTVTAPTPIPESPSFTPSTSDGSTMASIFFTSFLLFLCVPRKTPGDRLTRRHHRSSGPHIRVRAYTVARPCSLVRTRMASSTG